jgi:hypothetical protein
MLYGRVTPPAAQTHRLADEPAQQNPLVVAFYLTRRPTATSKAA